MSQLTPSSAPSNSAIGVNCSASASRTSVASRIALPACACRKCRRRSAARCFGSRPTSVTRWHPAEWPISTTFVGSPPYSAM